MLVVWFGILLALRGLVSDQCRRQANTRHFELARPDRTSAVAQCKRGKIHRAIDTFCTARIPRNNKEKT